MQSYQLLRDAAEPGSQAAYSMSFNCLSAPRFMTTLQKMMACLAALVKKHGRRKKGKKKKKKEKKVRRRWKKEAEM